MVGIALFVLLVLGCIAVVRSFSRGEVVGTVSFLGWTNVAGVKHAMVRFPAVTKRERKRNFFYFEFYRVRLDYEWVDESGQTNNWFLGENVGGNPFANSTADIPVPVPTNAVSMRFTGAQAAIERRWDNVGLPFELSSIEFRLEPPELPGKK